VLRSWRDSTAQFPECRQQTSCAYHGQAGNGASQHHCGSAAASDGRSVEHPEPPIQLWTPAHEKPGSILRAGLDAHRAPGPQKQSGPRTYSSYSLGQIQLALPFLRKRVPTHSYFVQSKGHCPASGGLDKKCTATPALQI